MGSKGDYEVTEEDQRKIVEFSLLHHKKIKLEQRLKLLEQQKNLLSDAKDELLVSMETPLYRIGECFMKLDESELDSELTEKLDLVNSDISNLTDQFNDHSSRSHSLKEQLYSKFGNRINLET